MNGHRVMNNDELVQEPEVKTVGKSIFTSTGVELHLVGVSPLLISKLQSIGILPEVPTRKMMLDFDMEEGATPAYQEEPLTEKDLIDDEEKKAWADYVVRRDAIMEKRNDSFIKAVFAKGVKVDMSRLEPWKMEMEYFGLEVPTNPIDLKVQYIQTEAIGNAQDMINIITGVLSLTGVQEEDLAEVRGMFQGAVRRPTAGEPDDAEGQVGMEPDLHGDEDGPVLGSLASEQILRGE